MRSPRRVAPPITRDTAPSTFAHILSDLIGRVPGALAAVLVDNDGEAMDYAGEVDPFALKLAGAHWQIVLAQAVRFFRSEPAAAFGRMRSLVIRGASRSFLVHALPDDYVLVVLLRRRTFLSAERAYTVCERALSYEAGWRIRARGPATTWFAVDIVATRGGRPTKSATQPTSSRSKSSAASRAPPSLRASEAGASASKTAPN